MLVQTKNPRTPQMRYAVQIFRLPLANAAILGLTLRNSENGILPLTGHLFRRWQHRFHFNSMSRYLPGIYMAVWNFKAIEEAFSDAAVNPAVWARALNVVTAQTEAFGAILIPVTGNILPNVPFSDRMEESLRPYFRREWHVRGEHMLSAAIMNKSGAAHDLKSADEIKEHLDPRNLRAPTGLGWCEEIKAEFGKDLWCLSIQRSLAQRPFSPEERLKLNRLSQSLSSAVAISRAVGSATTKAALDAFEVSDTAVLLIDRLGKVIRGNQPAGQLLEGDVSLCGGKLVSKDKNTVRAVEQAVYKFLGSSEAALDAPIPLPRHWQRAILVYLLKLPSLSVNPFAECQAIAVLIDPDRRWAPTEMTLRATFGFTPAEARLVSSISSGAPLDAIAASIGITRQTLKTQLKIIFAKAGVHRQAELVALVGSTANVAKALGFPAGPLAKSSCGLLWPSRKQDAA
jgi:DNA-binding CsgD family transcriptional regulator